MTAPTDTPFELNRQWGEAFDAGDLDRLMTMYEPDAVLVPGPGADPVQGHAAIAESLRWFLGLGGTMRWRPRHWLVCGDLALASIAFEMDGGRDHAGDPVDLRGATAEVLRRGADGTWRYVVDHPFGGAD